METGNQIVGFACSIISFILFAFAFIPAKKYEIGDGFFYQWCMCTGILFGGLLTLAAIGFQSFSFHLVSFLGGCVWALGNLLVSSTLDMIGIGLGQLIWGTTSMLIGWASSSFGLFGLHKSVISKYFLNYLGVTFVLLSLVLYAFVKPEVVKEDRKLSVLYEKVIQNNFEIQDFETSLIEMENAPSNLIKGGNAALNSTRTQCLGFLLAICVGIGFGSHLLPMQYEIDHGGDQNTLHYVVSLYFGIFCISSFFFLMHRGNQILKNEKYHRNWSLLAPGFTSGFIWSLAGVSRLIANQNLGISVSFPIISAGQSITAAMISVFVFREIKGTKNFLTLFVALVISVIAVTFIALSE